METPPVNKRYAVIGAGPAGLAAAYTLAQAGCQVDLYEAGDTVGGMSRSLELWGHTVDLGPHRFFSPSEEVNRFWFQTIDQEFCWVKRQTRIFYKKKYFEYPLQPLNTFLNLGLRESARSFLSYCLQKVSPRFSDEHFAGWVQNRFGKRLFEIFFKTYTEKLWGLPCEDIDSDFAYRKIRKLSFFEILKKFARSRKTFVEYFAYPHRGSGAVYQTLAMRFQKLGGRLFLRAPVQSLSVRDGKPQLRTVHGLESYDAVVSSMPLTHLVKMLEAPPTVQKAADQLSYRNTLLVYFLIEGYEHFTDNWIYVHSQDVDFGRVTNFRNWSPQLYGESPHTVVCLEYWCNSDDEIWKMPVESLVAKAADELARSGLIRNLRILESHVVPVPKSYPVFKRGYRQPLDVLKKYLSQIETVLAIGRYGAFKYNNQDHSILMGLKAAEALLNGHSKDLSGINSQAIYEEDFTIADETRPQFEEI